MNPSPIANNIANNISRIQNEIYSIYDEISILSSPLQRYSQMTPSAPPPAQIQGIISCLRNSSLAILNVEWHISNLDREIDKELSRGSNSSMSQAELDFQKNNIQTLTNDVSNINTMLDQTLLSYAPNIVFENNYRVNAANQESMPTPSTQPIATSRAFSNISNTLSRPTNSSHQDVNTRSPQQENTTPPLSRNTSLVQTHNSPVPINLSPIPMQASPIQLEESSISSTDSLPRFNNGYLVDITRDVFEDGLDYFLIQNPNLSENQNN